MKIALVHDYLKEYGGAERVLEALHSIYPQAPIYTSFVDFKNLGPHAQRIKKWQIKKSWIHFLWPVKKLHSPLRFLAPWVWKFFDFSEFDLVISSSGWYMCKGINTPKKCIHICYLHHPPRHLYGYSTALEWQRNPLIKIYASVINHFLRIYDFNTSQRVDYFLVNSQETKKRCQKFYRRDSTVIYPPVKTTNIPLKKEKGEYYLTVSRLARAKHIDLAIKACQKLNKPLKIVGKGRDRQYLEQLAKNNPNITFLGEVNDQELDGLYQSAKALIFPSEDEEFGIVSVEAQARGVPVIALKSGGVPETLIKNKTGILFDQLTTNSLTKAIRRFETIIINPRDCIENAKKFSQERFEKEIKKFVSSCVNPPNRLQ